MSEWGLCTRCHRYFTLYRQGGEVRFHLPKKKDRQESVVFCPGSGKPPKENKPEEKETQP